MQLWTTEGHTVLGLSCRRPWEALGGHAWGLALGVFWREVDQGWFPKEVDAKEGKV